MMKITLLTHKRELQRLTNTGQLVIKALGDQIELCVWQRKEPDEMLLAKIARGRSVLLYPTTNATAPIFDGEIDHLILLDATWQEAQKIYNRSAYLQALPAWCLQKPPPSQYRLRRNQRADALCTAEVVIHLLQQMGDESREEGLQRAFDAFNRG